MALGQKPPEMQLRVPFLAFPQIHSMDLRNPLEPAEQDPFFLQPV
jgi:hypothetical protein